MTPLFFCVVVTAMLLCVANVVSPHPIAVSPSAAAYVVVTSVNATPSEVYAADALAALFANVSGAETIPVVLANETKGAPQLAVGSAAAFALGVDPASVAGLGDEGVLVRSVAGSNGTTHYAITGAAGSKRGAIYAVYTFLEQLGVRFFAPDNTFFPTQPVTLPTSLAVTFVPPLEYRDTTFYDIGHSVPFQIISKTNTGSFDAAHGGSVSFASPPGFVHTSNHIVPPATYFKTHPEWFAEILGKRFAGTTVDKYPVATQLCWSNESLVDFITEQVQGYLRTQPLANIVSVSQNDFPVSYCECSRCRALNRHDDTPMGSLLTAVNRIADAIKDEFPHVAIDTLAYEYTRKAPRYTKPRPNVVVRLCSIEADFSRPLDDPHSHANVAFHRDIVNWSKISNRLWIWDYVTDFSDYVMPWPNYYSLGPNVKFFVNNCVTGTYEEGTYGTRGGDLATMKTYVLGKLLWNPSLDAKALISEFLDGHYGAAAGAVQSYIDIVHASALQEHMDLKEHAWYMSRYLHPKTTVPAAMALAEGMKLVTWVEADRMALALQAPLYVILLRWDECRAWCDLHEHTCVWPVADTQDAAFDSFAVVYKAQGLRQLSEMGRDLAWLQKRMKMQPQEQLEAHSRERAVRNAVAKAKAVAAFSHGKE